VIRVAVTASLLLRSNNTAAALPPLLRFSLHTSTPALPCSL
jgi:hypothetical protein